MAQNIEVIETKLEILAAQVGKLESKLDIYANQFIPMNLYEIKHRELEVKVNDLAKARMGQTIMTIIVSSAITAMLFWIIATAIKGNP